MVYKKKNNTKKREAICERATGKHKIVGSHYLPLEFHSKGIKAAEVKAGRVQRKWHQNKIDLEQIHELKRRLSVIILCRVTPGGIFDWRK